MVWSFGVAAALYAGVVRGDEPSYQHRPLSSWLVDLKDHREAAGRRKAAQAVGGMGQPARSAAPALVEALAHDPDATVREYAATALRNVYPEKGVIGGLLAAAVRDQKAPGRWQAIVSAGQFGDASGGVVPALIEVLTVGGKDVDAAVGALQTLRPTDEASVLALTALLKDRKAGGRFEVAELLASVGPMIPARVVPDLIDLTAADEPRLQEYLRRLILSAGRAAAPELVEALSRPSARARDEAARALGAVGAKEAVEPLLAALKDPDPDVRVTAAAALCLLERRTPEVIAPLVQALNGDNKPRRRAAASALRTAGPAARDAVVPLARAVVDPDQLVSVPAGEALSALGKEAVPDLVDALDETDELNARGAARVLDRNAALNHAAVRSLLGAIRRPSGGPRPGAAAALLRIEASWADEAVPVLIAALKSPRTESRLLAANALLSMPPSRKDAPAPPADQDPRAALIVALRDKNLEVRRVSARAVSRLDPPAPEAIPILIESLDDPPRAVDALHSLRRFGPAAQATLPALLEVFDRASEVNPLSPLDSSRAVTIRFEILKTFDGLDPDVRTVPALVSALPAPWGEQRDLAVRLLKRLGPRVAPDLLKAALAGKVEGRAASDALGGLGPDVLPLLVAWLDHADPKARSLARSAFAVVGPRAVPALAKVLAEGGPVARRGAVEAFVGFANSGPRLGAFEETGLTGAMQDPDVEVRIAAAVACRQLGLKAAVSEESLRAWIDALARDDPAPRYWAFTALGEMGPLAGRAAPALAGTLDNPRDGSRATGVLQGLGRDAVPDLVRVLRGGSVAARSAAARTLALIRQDEERKSPNSAGLDREIVPALAEAAKGPDAGVRMAAVEALRGFGKREAVPPLLAAFLGDDPEVRLAAANSLSVVDGINGKSALPSWAVPSLPGWIAMLKAAEPSNRRLAVKTLGMMGPAAKDAVAPIAGLLEDPQLSGDAFEALARIGPEAPGVIPALARGLRSPDRGVRCAAAQAFARLDAGAREALPALAAAASDGDDCVQNSVSHALGKLGPAAVPALVTMFDATRERAYGHATSVLQNMGDAAVPPLGLLLDDAAPSTRLAAVRVLASLAWHTRSDAAVSGLILARRHWDGDVRERAADVLYSYDRWASARGFLTALVLRPWRVVTESLVGWVTLAALGVALVRLRAGRDFVREGDEMTREFKTDAPPAVRYAAALRNGSTISPFAFLARHPGATAGERCEVLLVDQVRCWQSGTPRAVGEYLARCPEVAADDERVLDLLAGECRRARERGAAVDLGALLSPFPELRGRLHARLALEGGPAAPIPLDEDTRPQWTVPGAGEASPPHGTTATVFMPPGRFAGGMPETEAADDEHGTTRSYATRSLGGDAPDETEFAAAGLRASGSVARGWVGRYRIDRVLGEGAFGTVYLAHDDELRRPVAVKVPKAERIVTEEDVEAYLAEARVVAGLDHPGIVPVFDVGRTDDGLCYVVSKLIPDSDLARRLRRARPSPGETAAIVAGAAEALHHAHRRGLIHRDVKPANLLLDDQGSVYVADFGLALTREQSADAPLAGTPAYMSPEQARGGRAALDGRSDVFSLGTVFYELLTGVHPFRGASLAEVLGRVMRYEPPPPSNLVPAVGEELIRICMRCLTKDPSERFASADELASAVRRWERAAAAAGRDPKALRLTPPRGAPFGPQDADTYLDLFPGPRAEDGLPKAVRAWKTRIETDDPRRVLRVGVLSGPPGVGKSSFLRAGLIPRLGDAVRTVIVAAAAGETEARLLRALDEGAGAAPTLDEAFGRVAGGGGTGKTLVVIDQFDRWLIENPAAGPDDPLPRALLRADGRKLSVLLAVRDDFRPALARLLRGLGLAGADGGFEDRVEPFDLDHAYRVLAVMGRAYHRLPEDEAQMTADQRLLLHRISHDLAAGDTVLPLRLSQFVSVVRYLPWTLGGIAQLSTVGGVTGGLIATLEDRLGEAIDPTTGETSPAARALLSALLVDTAGVAGAGTPAPPTDPALMAILDDELRLITPVPPDPERPSSAATTYRLTQESLANTLQLWLRRRARTGRPSRPSDLNATLRRMALEQSDRSAPKGRGGRRVRRHRGLQAAENRLWILPLVLITLLAGPLTLNYSLQTRSGWIDGLPVGDFTNLSLFVAVVAVLCAVVALTRRARGRLRGGNGGEKTFDLGAWDEGPEFDR